MSNISFHGKAISLDSIVYVECAQFLARPWLYETLNILIININGRFATRIRRLPYKLLKILSNSRPLELFTSPFGVSGGRDH